MGKFSESSRHGEGKQEFGYQKDNYAMGKERKYTCTYTGRWVNDEMHGMGKVEWTDGSEYFAEFV